MGEGYRPDRFSEGDGGREERAPEPARRDPWSAALGIHPVRLRDYELPDQPAQPDRASPGRGDSGTDPPADEADATDHAGQAAEQADQADQAELADPAGAVEQPADPDSQASATRTPHQWDGAATETAHPSGPRSLEEADPDAGLLPETPRDRPGILGPDGVRRFATDTDGEAYGEQVLGAAFDQLDPAAQKAVYEYTRDSDPYNFVLRAVASGEDPQKALDRVLSDPGHRSLVLTSFDGHEPGLADVHQRISDIDAALSHPLPESIEVHRGLRSAEYLKGGDKDIRELQGTVQEEDAFVSASLGERAAFGGSSFPVQLHLRVSANMEGLWIGHRSRYPTEREILLPRGLRYEITEVVPDEDGRWHLYATAIESKSKKADAEGAL